MQQNRLILKDVVIFSSRKVHWICLRLTAPMHQSLLMNLSNRSLPSIISHFCGNFHSLFLTWYLWYCIVYQPLPITTTTFFGRYTLFGALITIAVSVIVSFISGFNNPREMDPKLFAPFMRKYLKLKMKREEPLGTEDDIRYASCVDLKAISSST